MKQTHAYQCDWQIGDECTCGLTGPRVWWMDFFPEDRAPDEKEMEVALERMKKGEDA